MVDCKMCGHPYCEHAGTQRGIVIDCANFTPKRKTQTNADRFRAMSNQEQQRCVRRFWEIEDFADWLKQPAKDGDSDG